MGRATVRRTAPRGWAADFARGIVSPRKLAARGGCPFTRRMLLSRGV
ncbi:MAG TPA: hypothetical protein VEX60_07105 [Pyrinomonadaceae bacterium]|nr:hypothetical protein [Pyrinomonadaceae bacterium]